MYALVRPDNRRIFDLAEMPFDVPLPMTWVDVPSDTTTRDEWDGTNVVKLESPSIGAQEQRLPAVDMMQKLKRELALAEIAADQPRINKTRREISRIKFMSEGV